MADISILILDLKKTPTKIIDYLRIRNHNLTATQCHSEEECCTQLKTGAFLTAIIISDTLSEKIKTCLKFSPIPVILISDHPENKRHYADTLFNNCIILDNKSDKHSINSVLEGLFYTHYPNQNKGFMKVSNDAVGTLAGGIAHEFNNMLGSIVGYSELIIEELPDSDPLKEYAGRILKISDKAKDLIKSMLMISREPDNPSESVNLKSVINSAIEEITSQSDRALPLETHFGTGPYTTRGNETHLTQMFKNVLNNALQAIDNSEGRVTVSVDKMPADRTDTQNELENGNYILIRVKDTGHGIDKKHLAKIFNPFFTTREPGQGTGLGLPIARSIAKSLGGTIEIAESSSKGTTTDIYLPLLDQGSEIHSEKDITINKILIVDDEKDLTAITQKLLNKKGFKTLAATSGRQGLEMFKQHADQIDLIITDIIMPDMNGAELISEIHTLKQDLPVIVMTGFMENLSILDNVSYNALLDKPVHFGTLLNEIEKIMYKGENYDQNTTH